MWERLIVVQNKISSILQGLMMEDPSSHKTYTIISLVARKVDDKEIAGMSTGFDKSC